MIPVAIQQTVVQHGVTGTWWDEIIELGLPLVLFVGMFIWSNRKEKRAKARPKDAKASTGKTR